MFAKVLKVRYLAVLALVLIMAASAYAFAAANIVPESGAGDGNNPISGYTVTNVIYTLGATPTSIDSVKFNIAPTASASAPTTVKAKLVSSGGSWFDCALVSGTQWSCPVTGVTALAANDLQVVAAQ